jgi:hypothetical protein
VPELEAEPCHHVLGDDNIFDIPPGLVPRQQGKKIYVCRSSLNEVL